MMKTEYEQLASDLEALVAAAEAWLKSLPQEQRASWAQTLCNRVWSIHGSLKPVRDPNKSRKIASRKRELALRWVTPRANRNPEMADEVYALYKECKQRIARIAVEERSLRYGLYVPAVFSRVNAAFFAVWQLPGGEWVAPEYKSVYGFERLSESLGQRRVPVSFTFDETCFIENGEIE